MRFNLQWQSALVQSVSQLTPTIRQIDIVPSGGTIAYSPGSHINVIVLVNDLTEIRSYSLVGEHASNRAYTIAVKLQPDSSGGSSYLWKLAPGARLEISNPHNLFELSPNRSHYLLIAAGIGITPILGMAQHLSARRASLVLLYAVRSRSELAFLDQVQRCAGPDLRLFISQEGTKLRFEDAFSNLPSGTEVYFCGPMPMLEEARRTWCSLGGRVADFRFETFGSSGQFPRESFEVFVRDRSVQVTVQPEQTMIEALRAVGVRIMSDCMRGECGLCLVDVLKTRGTIDHRDVFLSEDQKRAGRQVCACVSRVVGGGIEIDTGFRA